MKSIRFLFSILLALMIFTAIPLLVMAQTETPTTTPPPATTEPPPTTETTTTEPPVLIKLTMTTQYPKVEVQSGTSATFEVNLVFTDTSDGAQPKVFDLSVSTPKDWSSYITPQYPTDRKIASIQLDPQAFNGGDKIEVNVAPPVFENPDPGDYLVTLTGTAGDITASIDLTVKVTAKYSMTMSPTGSLYNTKVTSGQNNYFSITLVNTGSDPISNVALSADKPADWTVEFPNNGKIDNLLSGGSQALDVNIKPPSKAIAGDYQVTISAAGKEASADDLVIRVTVETPTIWGWVGVAIILIAIGGIAFAFMRFSRR